ncbi:MAG: diguanylate cyclase, partial [Pseudomonadota bacterium]
MLRGFTIGLGVLAASILATVVAQMIIGRVGEQPGNETATQWSAVPDPMYAQVILVALLLSALYGGALYFASVALWRRAEARIAESLTSRIATDHDSVTGLLNGAGFEAVAEQELNARKQGHLLAVIGIDMRGFKRLVAGGSPRLTDALLAEIATRLR